MFKGHKVINETDVGNLVKQLHEDQKDPIEELYDDMAGDSEDSTSGTKD